MSEEINFQEPYKGIRTSYHQAIIGKKRTGKSTLARALLEDMLRKYTDQNGTIHWKAIYSNTTIYQYHDTHPWNSPHNANCPVHPLLHKIHYLRELEEARYSPVFIDEISKAIPSRKVGTHNSEIYNLIQELMSNLGRWSCPLIYTDQWRRGADIMVRTNVDFVYQPAITLSDWNHKEGMVPLMYFVYKPKSQEFWELEHLSDSGVVDHTSMNLRDIFPLFNTEEAIPLTYNPPFIMEDWIKGLLEWVHEKGLELSSFGIADVRNILQTYQVATRNYITSKEQSGILGKLVMDGLYKRPEKVKKDDK